MDRITREKLKHDRFAEEVQHSVEYFGEHRKQVTLIGSLAAVVLVAGVGIYYYNSHQHSLRQADLKEALRIQDAAVGQGASEFVKSFPTKEEKDKAAIKAFTDLGNKYPGKDEGMIAKYYLGIIHADQGKLGEAEKYFQEVAAKASKDYAALAKFSLGQIYTAQGKTVEAEKLYRDLLSNPTTMVSKEQSTIALARVIARNKPEEARKMLEPLRTDRSAVSRAAIQAMSEVGK